MDVNSTLHDVGVGSTLHDVDVDSTLNDVGVDNTLHDVGVNSTLYDVDISSTLHDVGIDNTLHDVGVDNTLHGAGVGKDFLTLTSFAQELIPTVDKWNFTKRSCTAKETINQVKNRRESLPAFDRSVIHEYKKNLKNKE